MKFYLSFAEFFGMGMLKVLLDVILKVNASFIEVIYR